MPRYIDAEELDNQVKNKKPPYDMNSKAKEGFKTALLSIRSMIHSANNIDVQEVRHGHWILREGWFRCSECDSKALMKKCEWEQVRSDFCPACGAKMDFEE